MLTVSSVDTSSLKGFLVWDPSGAFLYDPDAQFDGLSVGQTASDVFQYTVTTTTVPRTRPP